MPCNVYVRGYKIMSNKHTDNNDKHTEQLALQQQSDEAFMNELYNEVALEDHSHPSELLDQRIISAAHKATQQTKTKKEKSKITWYSSLATAASLTLVISLVVLQQSNILPNEQANIMLKKGIILQKDIPSANDNDSFADREVVAEQIDFKDKASYSAISSELNSPVVSPTARTVTNITKVASAEKVVRAAQYKKQTVLAKQKAAERVIHLPPASMQFIEKIELNNSIKDERPITKLSIKQFQQYIFSNKTLGSKYQWLWSLHSENDMVLIIDIFQNNQQPLRYRLTKDTYQIIDVPTDNLKKLPFKNRELSEVIILNTNK
jgi:hypothetical protein